MAEFDLDTSDLNLDAQFKKTFIFLPVANKDMKGEYPELMQVEEFQMLTDVELRFVWLLGNKTSPFCLANETVEQEREIKREKALKASKLYDKISDKQRDEYYKGRFGQKIHNAIQRMLLFNPSLRMRAKLMNETMFNNMEKMVQLTEEELERMTVDDKKLYGSMCKTISENIDTLLPQVENAYGVREIKRKKGDPNIKEPTLMDEVLMS
jgi:hypothetical protein